MLLGTGDTIDGHGVVEVVQIVQLILARVVMVEIETADKDEKGHYIYNARYYTDGTGYTDTDIDTLVLVIDVNDNVWH